MPRSQGLYRDFRLPDWFGGPEPLREALRRAWSGRYADLYDAGGREDVDDAFKLVLSQLGDPDEHIPQKRYVLTALAMALASRPTLRRYHPEDERPGVVLAEVARWLEDKSLPGQELAPSLFPEAGKFGRYVAVDEAYSIFSELLRSLDPRHTDTSVKDILYAAITGDAISEFAAANRDIFNWWLVEVTPAAYYLRLPSAIYPAGMIFEPLRSE
jgi:hypothetical protein